MCKNFREFSKKHNNTTIVTDNNDPFFFSGDTFLKNENSEAKRDKISLTCFFFFVFALLSGDEEAMDLDEGSSTPPTNTAGVTLTQGLMRIPSANVSVVISISSYT